MFPCLISQLAAKEKRGEALQESRCSGLRCEWQWCESPEVAEEVTSTWTHTPHHIACIWAMMGCACIHLVTHTCTYTYTQSPEVLQHQAVRSGHLVHKWYRYLILSPIRSTDAIGVESTATHCTVTSSRLLYGLLSVNLYLILNYGHLPVNREHLWFDTVSVYSACSPSLWLN